MTIEEAIDILVRDLTAAPTSGLEKSRAKRIVKDTLTKIAQQEREAAILEESNKCYEHSEAAYARAIKDALAKATEQFVDEGWQAAKGDPDIRRQNQGINEGIRSVITALKSLLPNE